MYYNRPMQDIFMDFKKKLVATVGSDGIGISLLELEEKFKSNWRETIGNYVTYFNYSNLVDLLRKFPDKVKVDIVCGECHVISVTQKSSALPNYFFEDLFKFFTRYELFRLSLMCYRFCCLVEYEFPDTPYFIIHSLLIKLDYADGKWMLHCKNEDSHLNPLQNIKVRKFDQFRDLKFLRCFECRILIDDHYTQNEVFPIIRPIAHLWLGRKLTICSHACRMSGGIISHITKASRLTVTCRFDLNINFLQCFVKGNAYELIVIQSANSPSLSVELPIEDVVNFLLQPASTAKLGVIKKTLQIFTNEWNNLPQNLDAITNSIEQRFVDSICHYDFHFSWNVDGRMSEGSERYIHNPNTKQRLQICKDQGNNCFSFAATSSSNYI
ncbi:hypothetical protein Ddc_11741 [Ditylenchus destructor]|nr:hypothetical protein Ddc_11741 [Ditylenchus destructor]